MNFKSFLDRLQDFLRTGTLDLPGKECQISDPVSRLVYAYRLFERESYRNIESVSAGQYLFFYQMFTSFLVSISPLDFKEKVSFLDSKSRDLLLRGIEYASQEFPNLDFSPYSRAL